MKRSLLILWVAVMVACPCWVLADGGENCGSAVVIPSLPFSDTGTTSGKTNDYDEVCPYSGSTAPDVVYAYTASTTNSVSVTLCMPGTAYDSKLYIYANTCPDTGNPYACNDDFCTTTAYPYPYVSQVDVSFNAGNTYYIVIDGYGSSSGAFDLFIGVPPTPTPLPGACTYVSSCTLTPETNFNYWWDGCWNQTLNTWQFVSQDYAGNNDQRFYNVTVPGCTATTECEYDDFSGYTGVGLDRALAYQMSDGTYWTGSWNDDYIVHVDCVNSTCTQFYNAAGIAAMAMDNTNNHLWVLCNASPDVFYEYDVSSGTPVQIQMVNVAWQTFSDGYSAAGCGYDDTTNCLYVMNQDSHYVEMFSDLDPPGAGGIAASGSCGASGTTLGWGLAESESLGTMVVFDAGSGPFVPPFDLFEYDAPGCGSPAPTFTPSPTPQPPGTCPPDTMWQQLQVDENGSWSFATSDASFPQDYRCYDDFTVGADITGVNWWGLDLTWASGWSDGTKDADFEIGFHNDASGMPDATPAILYTTHPNVVYTGILYAGAYELNGYNTTITATTFNTGWISVQGQVDAANPNTVFLWGNSFDNNSLAYQWNAGLGALAYDLSMCLIGNTIDTPTPGPTNTPAPIPTTEPLGLGILILALSGLLSLSVFRRKK